MSKHTEHTPDRRQMLTATLRYATLGLLGTFGASVISQRRRLVREGKCINEGVCRGCEILQTCTLPQALSAKEILSSLDNGTK